MGRYNFCHCVYMIPLYCLLKSYQYYNTFNNVWYDFQIDYIPCLSDCNCRQPSNWRYQNISLASLKWVIINGFSGTSDEESLLCSIMKNAKGLSKVSIASSTGFSPSEKLLRKLRGLSTASCTFDYWYPSKAWLYIANQWN